MSNTEWLCPAWNQDRDAICGNKAQYLVASTSYCDSHAYDLVYIQQTPKEKREKAKIKKRHPALEEKLEVWARAEYTSTEAWNLYQDEEIWAVTDREESMSRGRFNNIYYQTTKRLRNSDEALERRKQIADTLATPLDVIRKNLVIE